MLRKSHEYGQHILIGCVNELSEERREILYTSWAGVFYREFFCRLDEKPFAVLYSDLPSRPNYPVNVLVSLEYLKAGFGWSDKEMYEAFLYNMQVRYAVGHEEFMKGDFELRTLYYFRERLSRYMQGICQTCPFWQTDQCPARPGKRDERHHLRFTQAQAHASQRRRQSQAQKKEGCNLRAAIEATLRCVKHPFPASKLPVRGSFRMACLLIGSAAMTNVRRIQHYLDTQVQSKKLPQGPECSPEQRADSFFCFRICRLDKLVRVPPAFETISGLLKFEFFQQHHYSFVRNC